MKLLIHGRNLEITPALRDYTQTKLERATHHFGDAVREADVHLSVARNPRVPQQTAEVTVFANGTVIRAQERSENLYASIDLAAGKLARQFPSGQIDAGVEVLAALLSADHRAVGKHRHLCGLLGHPGIARHGEMHIGLSHRITEVVGGSFEFGLGVIPQRRRDLEVATMDQQLHASLLCRLLSAS